VSSGNKSSWFLSVCGYVWGRREKDIKLLKLMFVRTLRDGRIKRKGEKQILLFSFVFVRTLREVSEKERERERERERAFQGE